MVENGFYIIKDSFFDKFNDPYLKGNKKESRPHYYAFKDKKTNLYWVVPISSRVEKYRKIMESKMLKYNGRCDTLHIAEIVDGRPNVFLIQDMFPITEDYIERDYNINGKHLMLMNDKQIKIISKKVFRVLHLIRKHYTFSPTQPDVLKIEQELLKDSPAKL